MKLIDFQGLNCYQNALITIAAFMGVDYVQAFGNLWPERDLDYDVGHKIYLSKRLPQNLAALGIKPEACSYPAGEGELPALSMLGGGEPLLVAMDTFHIPWSRGFQAVHDTHYFAIRKTAPGRLSCFDSTYNTECTISEDIALFFSGIYRINPIATKPLLVEGGREEIMHSHPQLLDRFLDALDKCRGEGRKNIIPLARYIDTMINNRYLYQHYLENTPFISITYRQHFDADFFSRWGAVKNGLFKAFVIRQNQDVLNEVSKMFQSLISEEISISAKP